MSKVSMYNRADDIKSEAVIYIEDLIDGIRVGAWRDAVEKYRKSQDPTDKKRLPGVTISGTFSVRKDTNITAFSGFICVDLDHLNEDVEEVRRLVNQDQYTYASFSSASGKGLAVLVKVDGKKFKESFEGLQNYYLSKFGLKIDVNCSNISRLRFVSFDPKAEIVNNESATFQEYPKKERGRPKKADDTLYLHTDRDIEFVLQQIEARHIDITGGYDEWYKIGWALISKYGENARGYFHRISQFSDKYDGNDTDKKFAYLLRTLPQSITIATFYYHAKLAGLEIYSPKTKQIAQIATVQKKTGATEQGVVNSLKKMEGIPVEESGPIVKAIFESTFEVKTEDSIIDQIELAIKRNYAVRYNIILSSCEFEDGRELEDRHANAIYLDLKRSLGKEVSKSDVEAILNSTYIRDFDPLRTFFAEYQHRKPVGLISQLAECIESDTGLKGETPIYNYVEYFLEKWLCGIVESCHGGHSPLMLVFTGRGNTGKTYFFRNLLPPDLIKYYAESKLDAGKDDELLMCQNLLILDDEFGGKSKQEAKKFKEISSKHKIKQRKAYGRRHENMRRVAVLCGTSNDSEVINDPTTSNRRIIPIEVKSLNWDKFNKIDKTDLFIEVYHRWKEGISTQNFTQNDIDSLKKATTLHEEISIEKEMIQHFYSIPWNGADVRFLSTTEIKDFIEKNSEQKIGLKRLGQELKAMGFEQSIKKENGEAKRGYYIVQK